MNDIRPCPSAAPGVLFTEWCEDCDHVYAAHRRDGVCSVCSVVAEVRALADPPDSDRNEPT